MGTRRVTLRALVTVVGLVSLGLSAGAAAGAPSGSGGEKVKIIAVFEDSVANPRAAAQDLERRHNGRLSFVYEHALKGFAGEFPQASLSGLQRDPRVEYVELDQIATIAAQETPTGVERIFADDNTNVGIGTGAMVDADVAVLDTGVDFEHPDLNVNTSGSRNCSGGSPFSGSCSSGGDDDNYHGTHVAGTIGALDDGEGVVGVAPGARIWSVKVLNSQGSGYFSWITAGIDYVTANAASIEVANMSLGCECTSNAASTAISNAVKKGVVFAVAAGNSDKNTATFFPANHPDVIAVSALADFNGQPGGGAASTCRADQDDTLAEFSNWGSRVDLAAPGVCIRSTYPLEHGGYGTISGTSMASPHVAGAAALITSRNKPTNKGGADDVRSVLKSNGNLNWTDDSGDGVKERLLDVSSTTVFDPVLVAGGGGGGTSNTAPVVEITGPATGSTHTVGGSVTFSGTATDGEQGDMSGSLSWSSDIDGTIGSGASFSTSSLSAGEHTITASVTDSGGLSGSDSITVTISNSSASGFTLSATGYKVKGVQHADLAWSGASSTNVDVFRNGAKVATTPNDDAYTDDIGGRGGGSYTYKVCEAGTTTCSDQRTVTF